MQKRHLWLGLSVLLCSGGPAGGSIVAKLVVDLVEGRAPAGAGYQPTDLVVFDEAVYFLGTGSLTGRELWRSDGTKETTRLLRESSPGRSGAIRGGVRLDTASLVRLEDALYFFSCDEIPICRLWRSDGTADGTRAVIDLQYSGAVPSHPTVLGDVLYFIVSDDVRGDLLWRSDGTATGTRPFLGSDSGLPVSRIVRVSVAANRLFFETEVRLPARMEGALWVSDGTAGGTERLTGVPSGTRASAVHDAGSRAFVYIPGAGLLATDGTAKGTRPIADHGYPIAAFDGEVYYRKNNGTGAELWIGDERPEGQRRLAGFEGPFAGPSHPAVHDAELLFASDQELWKTDGTSAGTIQLFDLGSHITSIGSFADDVWVSTLGALWHVGPGKATLIRRHLTTRDDMIGFGDGIVIVMWDRGELAFASRSGTFERLTDSAEEGSTLPVGLSRSGDALLFFSGNAGLFANLYRTLGAAEETEHLFDFRGRRGAGGMPAVLVIGDRPFFVGRDNIWRLSDSGALGLVFDSSFEPTLFGDFGSELLKGTATAFHDRLVFLLWNHDTGGIELWLSNGEPGGAQFIRELINASEQAHPSSFRAVASEQSLYIFAANRLFVGSGELDVIEELDLGLTCEYCEFLSALSEERLFFTIADPLGALQFSQPRALWTSDGTPEGTMLLREFASRQPGGPPLKLGDLAAVEGTLYFAAETPELGEELWRSDGSVAGTEPVIDLRLGPASSSPRWLTVMNGRLFFAANDGESGTELWTSDGTAAGTRQVIDISPGSRGSFVQELRAIEGALYLAADDGISGLEPWISDGSETRTWRLDDVQPGPLSSSPRSFTEAGSRIYFSAATEPTGRELWSLDRMDPCRECLHNGRFTVSVGWTVDGTFRLAQPLPLTPETVSFWFFGPDNTEVLVKIVDGASVNGHFWVLYGGLTSLEYQITVEDTVTGVTRTYHSPAGEACGGADVNAFTQLEGTATAYVDWAPTDSVLPVQVRARPPVSMSETSGCRADERTLCLLGGRFGVTVDWRSSTQTGMGRPIRGSAETGYFWFFGERNIELAIKMLDGRAFNDRMWFFSGAITHVPYTIHVTDYSTGAIGTYDAAGAFCGSQDIEAF